MTEVEQSELAIVEFLRARYDERAAAAERLAEKWRSWSWVPDPEYPTYEGEVPEICLLACNTTAPGFVVFEAGEHIALNDPAYVLADLESKRLQLQLHKDCDDRCYVLRVLAVSFAQHQDWRVEWRP